ncbi:MAG: hypothetical protein CFE38_08165 [Comamonadaceae bacterium PBBC1]|nr:MAG: hypothetical protein CFE38_08165 [Comamonadaceae bacterium PBBC1]
MKKMNISVVTVSMNRTEHLLKTAQAVSKLDLHNEHIILDYGTTIPISLDDLPKDSRIKLHRAESPDGKWWLTHSYNLAFALSQGDYILKLDADIIPSENLADNLTQVFSKTQAHLLCNRLTLQDWSLPNKLFTTNGLFFCLRASLEKIGGFNPYLRGWGWDEIDLYSRFFYAGFPVGRISRDGLQPIEHDDGLREHSLHVYSTMVYPVSKSELIRIDAKRRMSVQNEKNKKIAVASIENGITWPNFKQYLDYYSVESKLPELQNIILFNVDQKRVLAHNLVYELMRPTRLKNAYWNLLSVFEKGPYSEDGANSILDVCNIDLSKVS